MQAVQFNVKGSALAIILLLLPAFWFHGQPQMQTLLGATSAQAREGGDGGVGEPKLKPIKYTVNQLLKSSKGEIKEDIKNWRRRAGSSALFEARIEGFSAFTSFEVVSLLVSNERRTAKRLLSVWQKVRDIKEWKKNLEKEKRRLEKKEKKLKKIFADARKKYYSVKKRLNKKLWNGTISNEEYYRTLDPYSDEAKNADRRLTSAEDALSLIKHLLFELDDYPPPNVKKKK